MQKMVDINQYLCCVPCKVLIFHVGFGNGIVNTIKAAHEVSNDSILNLIFPFSYSDQY